MLAALLANGDDMTKTPRSSLPRTVNYAGPEGGVALRTDCLRIDIFGRVFVEDNGHLTAVSNPGLDALARYPVWTDFVTAAKELGHGSA